MLKYVMDASGIKKGSDDDIEYIIDIMDSSGFKKEHRIYNWCYGYIRN